MDTCDVAIIGGGPAGLSAAIYASRALLDVVVVEKSSLGGQILLTNDIENYPGCASIDGYSLAEAMRAQTEGLGVRFIASEVVSLDSVPDGFELRLSDNSLRSRSVIAAMGSSPARAGFPGESEFTGRGVSYCAVCDGMFYRGKHVFVYGGGNTAAEEALFLSKLAAQVTVVFRKDVMRAEKSLVDRLAKQSNITLRPHTVISGVSGLDLLTEVSFRDTHDCHEWKESSSEGNVGVFVCVGYQPHNDLVSSFVDLDSRGYIVTDESMAAGTPGLFAVGDCRCKAVRQIVTATSDGAIAGLSAADYLAHLNVR